jgi:4-amino-4-deoxy-L-arabinose transferase-like glycosyltransferase
LTDRTRPVADWLLLLGFCGFLFFFGLNYFGLIGADEPRYAQIAREMLARHDWITPVLGGKPWLEKPVLYYWQAMLSYSLFGVSDWAARIPSAVDATLAVIAVYWFLRRFRPGFQVDGALMAASAAGMIGFSRAASTDMPLAAAFTVAMLSWFDWHETQQRLYLATFYLFLALAALAKGPVGPVLAGLIVVIFALLRRDYRLLWRTLWLPGIIVFCTVALPWYVAVQLRNPDFFHQFILEHNLARFGTNLYHHQQPLWYYAPVTLLALLPWTIFVAEGVTENIRLWWSSGSNSAFSEHSLSLFLIIWLLVPVIFFSLSQSKLPGYILPALPAGTILLAE